MINQAIPPMFGFPILDQAKTEALASQTKTILIEGYIDGEHGVPIVLEDHKSDIKLKIYSSHMKPISVGIYLLNENLEEEITKKLEYHGGYRYAVINSKGKVTSQYP